MSSMQQSEGLGLACPSNQLAVQQAELHECLPKPGCMVCNARSGLLGTLPVKRYAKAVQQLNCRPPAKL